jgi:purine-binding chemotaxis protein CheW
MADLEASEGGDLGLLPEGAGHRYLVARAAGQRIAISLDDTREIIAVKALTRLPGAPSWVAGLLNVRGAVVTVLDVDARLGGEMAQGPVVIVETGGRTFGLRVTGVEAVHLTNDAPLAVEAARSADGVVSGMVPVGDSAALVLDVGALQRSALAEA